MNHMKNGAEVCVEVTILDALVLAKSSFHHSVNYRSVVIFGIAVEVSDPNEKMAAFETFVNHIIPGRWKDCRWPTNEESNATTMVKLDISESSAKSRAGPPKDDAIDMDLPHWTGLVPIATIPIGQPVSTDARVKIPDYISSYNLTKYNLSEILAKPKRNPVIRDVIMILIGMLLFFVFGKLIGNNH